MAENLGLTIARCDDRAAHPTHVWTPAPRAINGPKRCPGVAAVERTAEALRVIQKTADKQGNVTMLRLAENVRDHSTGGTTTVAHVCTVCLDALPAAWGCPDCQWIEERRLCDPVPSLLLGQPCAVHAREG